MVIAHKHVYFLWKMIFIKSSELSIVQPLKTCEALDGCFIDNRYIAKYDALEESFFSHQYERQIMTILIERMIVKNIAKGTTIPRHRVL